MSDPSPDAVTPLTDELTDEFFTGTVTDPILRILNHHQRTPLPGFICCCGEEFNTAHGYRVHVRSFIAAATTDAERAKVVAITEAAEAFKTAWDAAEAKVAELEQATFVVECSDPEHDRSAALVEALERIDGSGNPLIARDVLARYKEGPMPDDEPNQSPPVSPPPPPPAPARTPEFEKRGGKEPATEATAALNAAESRVAELTAELDGDYEIPPPKRPEAWPPVEIPKWMNNQTVNRRRLVKELREWADWFAYDD